LARHATGRCNMGNTSPTTATVSTIQALRTKLHPKRGGMLGSHILTF